MIADFGPTKDCVAMPLHYKYAGTLSNCDGRPASGAALQYLIYLDTVNPPHQAPHMTVEGIYLSGYSLSQVALTWTCLTLVRQFDHLMSLGC